MHWSSFLRWDVPQPQRRYNTTQLSYVVGKANPKALANCLETRENIETMKIGIVLFKNIYI